MRIRLELESSDFRERPSGPNFGESGYPGAIYENIETVLARGIWPATAKAPPARPQVSVKRGILNSAPGVAIAT